MTGTLRALVAAALAVVALVASGGLAHAQDGDLLVRIREANLDPSGATRLVVSVTGGAVTDVLGASAFTVTENGQPVADFTVEPLLEAAERPPVQVALVIDVSGSTQGEPLARAKVAAKAFVTELTANGVQVALVSFSDQPNVLSDFTGDPAGLHALIDGLEASGETALYDGVLTAANMLAGVEGQHNVVVFSDGADTVSQSDLAAALQAATNAAAPVTAVALASPEFDPTTLDSLAAGSGGRTLSTSEASELAAAFEQVASDIASQYVLSYTSTNLEPAELDLVVAVSAAASTVSDRVTVQNPRELPVAPRSHQPAPLAEPLVGAFATSTGFYVGIGAAFLALAALLGFTVGSFSGNRATRVLRQGLRFYASGGNERRPEVQLTGSSITQRAGEFAEHLPKPAGFDERLQLQLDRAGWPMRSSEFLGLQIMAAVGGGVVGGLLFANVAIGVFALLVGAVAPRLVLANRVDRRTSAFLEQLPDTLQLLAGSLKAGYGLLQAIDTVVKESSDPMSTEFARVLTEARLGMPLEDALDAMAERMGSEDFRWVVMAINIQKQVGGNLAALLELVANTLREREQVRRQIKVLSAEGRLSAVVLTALPFFLVAYLYFVAPEYIGELFVTTMGRLLVVTALVLMGIGVVWMRKLIKIEV